MFNLLRTSVAIAILASATTVSAKTDEIVVTAKGNQSISNVLATSYVFTLDDIEAAQVRDITGLLDQLPGVSVRDSGGRGSQTSVFVRGASNSQIIVLIDGVRVGSATLGAAALNAYSVEAIQRIEVVKGPFSGIYGADAVGGVIQLFTKKGGEGLGTLAATMGSNSLQEYSLSFNGGNERNSFHISAQTEDTDGIDRTSILSDGNADEDGYEETAVSLGAKLSLGDYTVANISLLSTDSTAEFDNTFGSDPGLINQGKTFSAALNVSTQLSEYLRWNNLLGSNEDELVTNGAFPSEFVTNRDSFGSELSYAFTEKGLLTVGLDYYKEDIESSNNFPVSDRDNTGIYAQVQTGLGDFGFVGSLRYDDNSAYGSTSNGSLALDYNFSENLRTVVSLGSAFVAPSFNFLYFPFFGNPDIQPEESDNIELSLIGTSGVIDWRVSAYQTDIKNLFSFDPSTFLAVNVGQSEFKGLELELNTQWAEWNLALNADLLSAEDKDSGTKLDDRAEQTLTITANRNFGKLDLRFDVKAESGRHDNSGTELSGFGLFDVSAKYQFNDNLSLLANIDNVLDKDYTLNLIGANNRYNTEGRLAQLRLRYNF
jgi:vitamin B12 transporter